ncbi:hypothetical protein RF11_03358 [Thelohanellus kitauei]|uniref:Winged helix-turn helix domain-containing protein n=1 Tax=Thelohanellus kitauei TaxID=669202 RepID=A0A0C2JQD7_THEKT|nr:hypothetical protein RF11_03358 [Thelohanellus kitauei]
MDKKLTYTSWMLEQAKFVFSNLCLFLHVIYTLKCSKPKKRMGSIETSNRIEADQRGGKRCTKITLEIEYQIRQLVADNCTTTIKGIIDILVLDVCHKTVWRWLKKNNYSWKITRPIPKKRDDPEIKAKEWSMCYGTNLSSLI